MRKKSNAGKFSGQVLHKGGFTMGAQGIPADSGRWLADVIRTFVATSDENALKGALNEKAFDRPLVGFSSGADPLYAEYVAHIGDFYLQPVDFFKKTFTDEPSAIPEELTVISWILPSTGATRRDQATMDKRPCERWIRVRHHGERFNVALRHHVVATLASAGIPAVAPMVSEFWSRSDEGPWAPCSNWSERHAAYAAGLGTFGLCDGLITSVGKAIRIGSVIARLAISPTERPYTDHHAYCLFYSQGTCGKCIPRCPVNALSESGHDKQKCMRYTHDHMNRYTRETFNIDSYACGLCQAGVPCTDHIPDPAEG